MYQSHEIVGELSELISVVPLEQGPKKLLLNIITSEKITCGGTSQVCP